MSHEKGTSFFFFLRSFINSFQYSLEGLMLKLKLLYFGHLVWRNDSLEKILMLEKTEGRRRGRERMRWLDGITDSMDMSLSTDSCRAAVHGTAESDMTERLSWTQWSLTRCFFNSALVKSPTFSRLISFQLKKGFFCLKIKAWSAFSGMFSCLNMPSHCCLIHIFISNFVQSFASVPWTKTLKWGLQSRSQAWKWLLLFGGNTWSVWGTDTETNNYDAL